MKRMSIKLKLTLLYTAVILIMAAFVLGFTVLISQNVSRAGVQNNLEEVVNTNLEEVEYDDGDISVDDDFAQVSRGVSSLVYVDGTNTIELISGSVPSGFSATLPLVDNQMRTVESNGQVYYVYDRKSTIGQNESYNPEVTGSIWVRGIAAESGSAGTHDILFIAMIILLPLIILAAILLGYLIAKRAFKPIEQITNAANAISEGQDLSKRIGMPAGKDEISQLAATFDSMFARLEASFDEQRRFNADVSHELRTPMAVIVSQCEYSLEHGQHDDECREALETIHRQANKMSQLINQLLSFSRLERGLEKPNFAETDMSALCLAVCEEQRLLLDDANRLQTQIQPDIYAKIDTTLFERMLNNLLSNAIKYGRDNGWCKVSLVASENEIVLSVSDNGRGIAEEDLPRIWGHFFQVNPARTSENDSGCGLGLAMVKQIARLHEASVSVSSKLGQGSTFVITFAR